MKEKHLKELEKLDVKVLERLVELSQNQKLVEYLSNTLLFVGLKALINKHVK